MAEVKQRTNVGGGSTRGDVESEIVDQEKPESAEDRKAATALSKLDLNGDNDDNTKQVDVEAIKRAIQTLSGDVMGLSKKAPAAEKEVQKKPVVKVDAADVTLLVGEFEISKIKATELLKAHDGDAVRAIKALLAPVG